MPNRPSEPLQPHRHVLVVFDLHNHGHRRILDYAARSYIRLGQDRVAMQLWDHLDGTRDTAGPDPDTTTELTALQVEIAEITATWPAIGAGDGN